MSRRVSRGVPEHRGGVAEVSRRCLVVSRVEGVKSVEAKCVITTNKRTLVATNHKTDAQSPFEFEIGCIRPSSDVLLQS